MNATQTVTTSPARKNLPMAFLATVSCIVDTSFDDYDDVTEFLPPARMAFNERMRDFNDR
jgi:hypothetical protein